MEELLTALTNGNKNCNNTAKRKGGLEHMEYYPWWNDAQKKLAEDAKKIADETLMPLGERAAWKKEYPWGHCAGGKS